MHFNISNDSFHMVVFGLNFNFIIAYSMSLEFFVYILLKSQCMF